MALSFSYNTEQSALGEIFTASSGGTVFSANKATATAFDYFTDTAVVNDAIYFSCGANNAEMSDFTFNVGTPLVADSITIKWEYYKRNVGWTDMEDLVDNTANFTISGINRVKFSNQWQLHTVTINGLSRIWFRCRISAVTNLTEGGANQTTAVKKSLGLLTITGGTDAVPGSFTEIYNWIKANLPHITVTNTQVNEFDFTKIALNIKSRVVTKNEVVNLGQDGPSSQTVGRNDFSYIESGTKVNIMTGHSGSTFIIHGSANSSVFVLGGYSRVYGSILRTGKTSSDAYVYAGYCSLAGEVIDTTIELSTYVPGNAATVISNVRIVASLLIASGLEGTFSNIKYLCTSTSLFYVYRNGFTLPDFSYTFRSTGSLFYLYQGSDRVFPEWKLVNPSTPLNEIGSAVQPIIIGSKPSLVDIAYAFFYDSSSGTYTDYTTNAKTTGGFPLSGDVGDYYLFGANSVGAIAGFGLDFQITAQANDYQYEWEYYYAGAWRAVIDPAHTYFWDATDNMTKSGRIWTALPMSIWATIINGVSSIWIRARITNKGSASPIANKIRKAQCSGVSDWKVFEQYSFALKVSDENGNPLENATVTATNEFGTEIFSVNSDINGDISSQIINAKKFFFDPIGNPVGAVGQEIYTSFSFSVSKEGYETYASSGNPVGSKLNLFVSLKIPVAQNPIATAIESENLSAEISGDNLQTELSQQDFSVEITESDISGSKSEENIVVSL